MGGEAAMGAGPTPITSDCRTGGARLTGRCGSATVAVTTAKANAVVRSMMTLGVSDESRRRADSQTEDDAGLVAG